MTLRLRHPTILCLSLATLMLLPGCLDDRCETKSAQVELTVTFSGTSGAQRLEFETSVSVSALGYATTQRLGSMPFPSLNDGKAEVTGSKYFLVKIPVFLGICIAGIMLAIAKLTGRAPLITPGLMKRYSHNWSVSGEKARKELGYDPVDFSEGLIRTVKWLKRSIH